MVRLVRLWVGMVGALAVVLGAAEQRACAQACGGWIPGAAFDAVPNTNVIGFAVQTAGGANELWCAMRGGAHDEATHTDGSGVWTTVAAPFATVRYTASGVWNGQPVFGYFDDAAPTLRGVAVRTGGGGWSTFGATGFANVRAFTVLGGTLYAVGVGEVAGTSRGVVWANGGAGWSLLAMGEPGSEFLAAATYNGQVYLGGRFATIQMVPGPGTLNAVNLARFDGAIWTEVPFSRLDNRVTTLYTYSWDPTSPRGGELVVSGDFLLAGGVNANHLAAFTDPPIGGYWHALGTGLDGGPATGFDTRITGLGTADLMVGGTFTSAGGATNTKALARWSNNAWSGVGVQFTSVFPVVLANHRGLTVIGGRGIDWMLGVRMSYVTGFDGHRVHTIGRGTDHEIFELSRSTDGSKVYAVGIFSLIEDVPAAHIACKSLSTPNAPWTALGDGTNGSTTCVLGDAGNVYVGGQFTEAGTAAALNVAKWNGTAWSAMPGVISTWQGVSDLLMFNGLPTAVGSTFAGNSGVAQWNGTTWVGLGPAWPTNPYAVPYSGCVHNGQLYIAGSLSLPGSGLATVARWTGATWAAVGTFPLNAYAIASYNGSLYASSFTTNNSGNATVYRFDGAAWVPTNAGEPPLAAIYELKVVGGRLYAVGAEKYTGVWDGTSWRRLDSPGSTGSTVYAVESCGGDDRTIAFGGYFEWLDPSVPAKRLARFQYGCIADFNCSGTVSVQDIFDFLAAYFAGNPSADVNSSGGVSVQDIFDFLAAYFAGCTPV